MQGQKTSLNERPAPAAHTRHLSSRAAATSHGKTQGFVPRLSPQIKPHARLMQPLQCVSKHHVANPHLFTHMATQHENIHANIHCDLQPQIPKHPTTTHTNAPKAASTHRYNAGTKNIKMNGPHPPHTQGTFHRGLQPLHTEKHKVSCSGSLPKSDPMQHSCRYYNAFCSITSLTRISLRTWQHSMKTFMQTLHCDLQAQIPKHPTTTHTQTHPKQHQPTVTTREQKTSKL